MNSATARERSNFSRVVFIRSLLAVVDAAEHPLCAIIQPRQRSGRRSALTHGGQAEMTRARRKLFRSTDVWGEFEKSVGWRDPGCAPLRP